MADNVLKFYKKDAAADIDVVLERAIGEYREAIIIGFDKNGELDLRGPLGITPERVLWLASILQHKLLRGDYS